MIAEIANSLARIPLPGEAPSKEPAVCVIEAGTGTGKTIAYAVTAIPMAKALGKRLVVATANLYPATGDQNLDATGFAQ